MLAKGGLPWLWPERASPICRARALGTLTKAASGGRCDRRRLWLREYPTNSR